MTDWIALAHARDLNIPDEAVHGIASSLAALEAAFRPLTARLSPQLEPSIILSESAVLGQ